MRYVVTLLCIILFTFSLILQTAEAKRFGGGRSFGIQRNISKFSRLQPQQLTKPFANTNRWFAPLAGLLTGGLLAYLLMGNGLGAGILSWLAIAGIALLLVNLIRNRNRLQPATSSFSQKRNSNNEFYSTQASPINSQTGSYISSSLIDDKETFLRDVKTKFMRLQAAYDQKNLNDLREFTTPEVFAEIQLQLQERNESQNQTDVVTLNAELLDAENEFGALLASVRFSGLIREDANQSANSFNEIWHFRKDSNNYWLVAGVQQN